MALDTTPISETSAFTAAIYPPKNGTPNDSADVAAGEQALANRTKFLNDTKADWVVANGKTIDLHGEILVESDGAIVNDGTFTNNNAVILNGTTTLTSSGEFVDDGGTRLRGTAVNDLTWGSHTLDRTTKQRVRVGNSSGSGDITITLKDTASAQLPPDGYEIEFTAVFDNLRTTSTVSIARETPSSPGTLIAKLGLKVGSGGPMDTDWPTQPGSASDYVAATIWLEKQGGVWSVTKCSGPVALQTDSLP